MRCFVALEFPEDLKTKIMELQEQLSSFDAKLVEPKNLHFTLKFLGEINRTAIETVTQKLSVISGRFSPFSILLTGVGAFPSLSYIRVIWIGAKSQDLVNLHNSVAEALKALANLKKRQYRILQ